MAIASAVGGDRIEEGVADDRDRSLGDRPVPGADGGAVGAARNGAAGVIKARPGRC